VFSGPPRKVSVHALKGATHVIVNSTASVDRIKRLVAQFIG
jgi:hypothetical protein